MTDEERIRLLDGILVTIAAVFALVVVYVLVEFLTGEPTPTPDYDNVNINNTNDNAE